VAVDVTTDEHIGAALARPSFNPIQLAFIERDATDAKGADRDRACAEGRDPGPVGCGGHRYQQYRGSCRSRFRFSLLCSCSGSRFSSRFWFWFWFDGGSASPHPPNSPAFVGRVPRSGPGNVRSAPLRRTRTGTKNHEPQNRTGTRTRTENREPGSVK